MEMSNGNYSHLDQPADRLQALPWPKIPIQLEMSTGPNKAQEMLGKRLILILNQAFRLPSTRLNLSTFLFFSSLFAEAPHRATVRLSPLLWLSHFNAHFSQWGNTDNAADLPATDADNYQFHGQAGLHAPSI